LFAPVEIDTRVSLVGPFPTTELNPCLNPGAFEEKGRADREGTTIGLFFLRDVALSANLFLADTLHADEASPYGV
jgi:hypothetical protein